MNERRLEGTCTGRPRVDLAPRHTADDNDAAGVGFLEPRHRGIDHADASHEVGLEAGLPRCLIGCHSQRTDIRNHDVDTAERSGRFADPRGDRRPSDDPLPPRMPCRPRRQPRRGRLDIQFVSGADRHSSRLRQRTCRRWRVRSPGSAGHQDLSAFRPVRARSCSVRSKSPLSHAPGPIVRAPRRSHPEGKASREETLTSRHGEASGVRAHRGRARGRCWCRNRAVKKSQPSRGDATQDHTPIASQRPFTPLLTAPIVAGSPVPPLAPAYRALPRR